MTSRYFEIYSNHNNDNEDDAIVSIASSFDSSIDMSFVLAAIGCILLLFVVIIISIVVYRGNNNNNDKSLIVMKNSNAAAAAAAAAAPRVAVASIRLFKEHVSYLVVIDLMTILILSLILIKDLSAIVPLDRLPSSIFSIYSVERFFYAVIGLFVLYLFQSASPLLLLILLSAMAFQSATLRVVVGGLLLLLMASALVLYCGRELLANANNTLFISVATVNVAVLLGGASALLNGYQLFGSV
jgi:hypothetical protein